MKMRKGVAAYVQKFKGFVAAEYRKLGCRLERIGKKMSEKRYLVIDQYEDDNSIRVCESLEEANVEAESTWYSMSVSDKKRHHVYVIDVTGKDVGWEDGEPVWADYHCGGYEPGRFDSDTL